MARWPRSRVRQHGASVSRIALAHPGQRAFALHVFEPEVGVASAASAWLAAASICHTVRLLSRASLSAIAFHHTGVDAA
jgi:hypothetical protein